MNTKRILSVCGAVALGVSVYLFGSMPISDTEAQIVGAQAPSFSLITLKGDVITKESLKGQPTLLMFWAPWCPVCRKELPILGQFYRTERPPKLRVVSVGFADQRENVVDYVNTNAETFAFPTAYDDDNRTAEAFGVSATPTFVLLDQGGAIALVHRGGGINQNPKYQEFLTKLKT